MNSLTLPPMQRYTLIWALMTFGLAASIAALTLMPQAPIPAGPQGADKLYHIAAFAALLFPTGMLRPQWWLYAGCSAILYGGMIEVIQPSFGRSASIADLLADVLGVGIGILTGWTARRILLTR